MVHGATGCGDTGGSAGCVSWYDMSWNLPYKNGWCTATVWKMYFGQCSNVGVNLWKVAGGFSVWNMCFSLIACIIKSPLSRRQNAFHFHLEAGHRQSPHFVCRTMHCFITLCPCSLLPAIESSNTRHSQMNWSESNTFININKNCWFPSR